jgi:YbgC/YbaW family acyl-CoA thioester hydrolase
MTRTPFTVGRRVDFADTDAGGVVHFSRYFVYMETAEHLFLAAHGIDVHARSGGRLVSWPRVEATCRYLKPLHHGDPIEIEVRLARRGVKSLTFEFTLRRAGEVVAEGRTVSVCCDLSGDRFTSIPIPEDVVARLERS